MQQLAEWQQSLVVTVRHPPRLLRWISAAIFAAFALIGLREIIYWLGFVFTYFTLPDAVVTGLLHCIFAAVWTIIALFVVRLAWPHGDTIASAATLLDEDELADDQTRSAE